MTLPHLVWAHGRESAPWGSKSIRLKSLAEEHHMTMTAPDCEGILDADKRVEMIVEHCKGIDAPVALVGSSMGGYVSTVAAPQVNAIGLFLLAPAFYLDFIGTVREFGNVTCPVTMLHGWNDDVVPCDNAIRFAREHKATLLMLDAAHRLHSCMDQIEDQFRLFLRDMAARG